MPYYTYGDRSFLLLQGQASIASAIRDP